MSTQSVLSSTKSGVPWGRAAITNNVTSQLLVMLHNSRLHGDWHIADAGEEARLIDVILQITVSFHTREV